MPSQPGQHWKSLTVQMAVHWIWQKKNSSAAGDQISLFLLFFFLLVLLLLFFGVCVCVCVFPSSPQCHKVLFSKTAQLLWWCFCFLQ